MMDRTATDRMSTNRYTLLVASVLLSLPAAAEAQGNSVFDSDDHLWVVGDVRVPAVADTFALMRVSRYPVLSLGVGLTYAGPPYGGPLFQDLDLSIYVYPSSTTVEDPIRSEFDQAVRDVHVYAERQRPPWTVTVKREEPFALSLEDGQTLDGMFAEAEYFRSPRTSRTLVYVFEKDGLILKYRVTYDTGAPPELKGHLDSWLRITASQIERYGR